MYILINKDKEQYHIIKEKIKIIKYLGITTKTLTKHLNDKGIYENETYKVIIPHNIDIKSNRGNADFNYRKPKNTQSSSIY